MIPAWTNDWNRLLFSSLSLIVTGFILLMITCYLSDHYQNSKDESDENGSKNGTSEADTNQTSLDGSFVNLGEKY